MEVIDHESYALIIDLNIHQISHVQVPPAHK